MTEQTIKTVFGAFFAAAMVLAISNDLHPGAGFDVLLMGLGATTSAVLAAMAFWPR